MKVDLNWQSTPQLWMATFDNYDGAPDSKHPVGLGKTPGEAVADLFEQDYERRAAREVA